nr:MAG TPA: hypothetical protein [Caudoviricetes sp.]
MVPRQISHLLFILWFFISFFGSASLILLPFYN